MCCVGGCVFRSAGGFHDDAMPGTASCIQHLAFLQYISLLLSRPIFYHDISTKSRYCQFQGQNLLHPWQEFFARYHREILQFISGYRLCKRFNLQKITSYFYHFSYINLFNTKYKWRPPSLNELTHLVLEVSKYILERFI